MVGKTYSSEAIIEPIRDLLALLLAHDVGGVMHRAAQREVHGGGLGLAAQ